MPSKKKEKTTTKLQPEAANQNGKEDADRVQQEAETQLRDDIQQDTSRKEELKATSGESKGTDTVRDVYNLQDSTDNLQPRSSRSWYGTWPKKSRDPVVLESAEKGTEIKKEITEPKDIPTKRASLISPGSSGRSLPLVATITKLNVSSEGSKSVETKPDQGSEGNNKPTVDAEEKDDKATHSENTGDDVGTTKPELPTGTMTPTSWLSWSRGAKSNFPSVTITSSSTKVEPVADSDTTSAANNEAVSQEASTAESVLPEPAVPVDPTNKSDPLTSSVWYPRWPFGGSSAAEPVNPVVAEPAEKPAETQEDVPMPDAEQDTTKPVDTHKPDVDIKRSSWAFWSNSSMQGNNASGQLAVANSSSQSHPEPATVQEGSPVLTADDKKKRPLSQGDEPARKKQAPTSSTATVKKTEEKVKEASNILLPTFESTYSVHIENASIWQQIGNWIYANNKPKHPTLLKEPRKIKHALAIGVHGYFPAAIVQTVIGKPTGTSIRFADSAAKAIETFAQDHNISLQSLDKIALEGEGRIDERLDILWKLLLNWIDLIRKADFILVACHSQGVPVAISLVSKLIGFGCVSEARIGICAMAGISRGPFAEYKSRWIGGSAAELFEFSDPNSSVSRAYRDALETVVRFGVKVTFVGSLDDQLVPLHSSTFTHVDHPNIYRAVFVDGRMHVADFISHLVGFALKLRNLNTSDHGLVRELSNPLAGSLVGGEGHSRVYDDPAVYNLAMDFTLRTSDVTGDFQTDDTPMPATMNPYILPFAMRGVLEEDIVRRELSGEVIDLLKQFDRWKPSTKVLRDVKYRLEGVRSKL